MTNLLSPIVVDTNVIISAFLAPKSISYQVFLKASTEFEFCFSNETWQELIEVIHRPKFAKYFKKDSAEAIVIRMRQISRFVEVTPTIHGCRDPKDDKFLTLALASSATLIISGDKDLQVMNPFQGIEILSPADFLKQHPQET